MHYLTVFLLLPCLICMCAQRHENGSASNSEPAAKPAFTRQSSRTVSFRVKLSFDYINTSEIIKYETQYVITRSTFAFHLDSTASHCTVKFTCVNNLQVLRHIQLLLFMPCSVRTHLLNIWLSQHTQTDRQTDSTALCLSVIIHFRWWRRRRTKTCRYREGTDQHTHTHTHT